MMKKLFICFVLFLLSACRVDDMIPIEVERTTLYHGQTVESLFDNFGIPTKQSVDDWGIRAYHYSHQSVLKRGVKNYIYYCDFVVFTDEGIVIDWYFYGNRCQVEPVEKEFYLD